MENNSFVFYKSFLDTAEEVGRANPELAYKYLQAIAQYGIYGTYDESDPVLNGLMVSATMGIDRAQERYQEAKDIGKSGGRPRSNSLDAIRELASAGLTTQEIADNLNCSVRTVQRGLKTIRDKIAT